MFYKIKTHSNKYNSDKLIRSVKDNEVMFSLHLYC